MATIGTLVTLADLARRSDKEGKIQKIVEMLNQTNEIITDMMFVEGNLPTGHLTTVRTGLPSATWRKLNYGVQPAKSTTAQVTDTCGMLEAYAEVDKRLADLNGNAGEFRLSEDQAFIESMTQEMADTLIYGDPSKNPAKFLGLAPRYAKLSTDSTKIGYNIVNAGGTVEDINSSVWLVVWGPNTVHGIVPKSSTAGLSHRDLGEVTLLDANGGKYQGYRTHYKWDMGLTVRDWRYAVRIANINMTKLLAQASDAAVLSELFIKATKLIPSMGMGRPVFYANKDIATYLEIQALNKSNVHLSVKEGVDGGAPVTSWRGIPIRRVDKILSTEKVVS